VCSLSSPARAVDLLFDGVRPSGPSPGQNREDVQYVDYTASPQHTTAYAQLTINKPGKYFVRMANYFDKSQVWATSDCTVGEDTVGARAAGNTAAGQGKVSICKEVDDDWKWVGQSNQWGGEHALQRSFPESGSGGG
jgi:hypothetical protein